MPADPRRRARASSVYAVGLKGRISALLTLASSLVGWVLVGPLTWVVRRDPALMVLFGRDGGAFADNCKHLYVRAVGRAGPHLQPVFLASDRDLAEKIRTLGGRAEIAGSAAGLWLWLRAGTIIVDSIDWMRGFRFAGARGARVMQMWHGIPLKLVQIARVRARPPLSSRAARLAFTLYLRATGRFVRTHWFLSTSPYVTANAFAQSFNYERVSHAGYPRNDALFVSQGPLAELGVDDKARKALAHFRERSSRGKIGLYAPTFRESMHDPFASGDVDLDALSGAVTRLDILLLIKLHPWMHGRIRDRAYPGLFFVEPASDAYPLMRDIDFLVTDYSSIYFDFLLVDRPILFFPYDLDGYLKSERRMYFDYGQMSPGPRSRTVTELISELERVCTGADRWAADRARVRDLVFSHQDGRAADRVLDDLYPGR